MFAGDQAGSYSYAVSAINRYGESQLVALGSAPIAVTTAQSVDLKFTGFFLALFGVKTLLLYRKLCHAKGKK